MDSFLHFSLLLLVRFFFLFLLCLFPLLYDFISVPLPPCSRFLFYVSLSYIWLGEVECVFVFWLILHFLHQWILSVTFSLCFLFFFFNFHSCIDLTFQSHSLLLHVCFPFSVSSLQVFFFFFNCLMFSVSFSWAIFFIIFTKYLISFLISSQNFLLIN